MDGGGSTTTVQNNVPEPTPEERELTALSAELARRQLANIDALAPFQQRLLETGISELDQNAALRDAYLKAFPVEEQASLAREQADLQRQALGLSQQDFELRQQELDQAAIDAPLQREISTQNLELLKQQIAQAADLAPIQKEVALAQLEQIRNGGRATPEQLAAIKEAADRGIEAGSADIDMHTQRGIGLISDELANSRGLRLTDTPILREATLLTQSGEDQKSNLVKSMRANEANAAVNYPLAASGVTNAVLSNDASITNAAQNFQAQLRQQAQANRLALTGSGSVGSGIGLSSGYSPASTVGSASGIGLGLAGIGNGGSALQALTSARMASGSKTSTTENDPGFMGIMTGIGSLGAGLGGFKGLF